MNVLLNLVKPNVDDYVIDEIYLYANYEKKKNQYLNRKHEKIGLEHYKDSKTLI